MISLRALLAAVSLVVLGAVLGVAADRAWRAQRQPVTVVMDTGHTQRFRSMLDSLALSDSQRVAINSLLGHFQDHVNQAWQSLQPRLQITTDSARLAIEAVLTEDQRAAFHEWMAVEQGRMHGTGATDAPFRH